MKLVTVTVSEGPDKNYIYYLLTQYIWFGLETEKLLAGQPAFVMTDPMSPDKVPWFQTFELLPTSSTSVYLAGETNEPIRALKAGMKIWSLSQENEKMITSVVKIHGCAGYCTSTHRNKNS